MNEQMVRNVLGTEAFTELLSRLPDAFYILPRSTRDAFWKALLGKVNQGTREIDQLLKFGGIWLLIYIDIKINQS